MRRSLLVFLSICLALLANTAAAKSKSLLIYFIDVEGGQATLVVGPTGQSLLIDAGNPGKTNAQRIMAAAKDAKVKQIDFLLVTHFHADHLGGIADLLDRTKVGTFVDHGANMEASDRARENYAGYEKLIGKGRRLVVKPGDGLPIKELMVEIIAANGDRIDHPLPNAGTANPWCDREPVPDRDDSENGRSIGSLITYGKFRFLDLGDLSRRRELDLACPNNMIGTVDLFLVTHHGAGGSNARALDWALHPRVAVIANGGGRDENDPEVWGVVRNSPGLQDLWQLHEVPELGNGNPSQAMIANLDDKPDGNFIKVRAKPNGSFTVFNSRNRNSKLYDGVAISGQPSALVNPGFSRKRFTLWNATPPVL